MILAMAPTTFAADFEPRVMELKEERIEVATVFYFGEDTVTETVPIYGTYTNEYILNSLENHWKEIEAQRPGGAVYEAKEDRKAAAVQGLSDFSSEIGKRVKRTR